MGPTARTHAALPACSLIPAPAAVGLVDGDGRPPTAWGVAVKPVARDVGLIFELAVAGDFGLGREPF